MSRCRVGDSMSEDYDSHALHCPQCSATDAAIRVGDVVMFGQRQEPPMFRTVTTIYECNDWEDRRAEVMAVYRPIRSWSAPGASGRPSGRV